MRGDEDTGSTGAVRSHRRKRLAQFLMSSGMEEGKRGKRKTIGRTKERGQAANTNGGKLRNKPWQSNKLNEWNGTKRGKRKGKGKTGGNHPALEPISHPTELLIKIPPEGREAQG